MSHNYDNALYGAASGVILSLEVEVLSSASHDGSGAGVMIASPWHFLIEEEGMHRLYWPQDSVRAKRSDYGEILGSKIGYITDMWCTINPHFTALA